MIGKLFFDFVQALKRIDGETQLLLLKFLIRAGKSGDANRFVQDRLQRIFDEDDQLIVSSSPRQVHVTAREVKKP